MDLNVNLYKFINWILFRLCTNCPSFLLIKIYKKSRNKVSILESVFRIIKFLV